LNEDKSARFHRLKRRAAFASLLLTVVFLGSLLLSGRSASMRDAAAALSGGDATSPLTIAAYVLLLASLNEFIALPAAFYRSFLLERRYGLSHEPMPAWLQDHAKASMLGAGLGVAGADRSDHPSVADGWWAPRCSSPGSSCSRLTPTLLLPIFCGSPPNGNRWCAPAGAVKTRRCPVGVRVGMGRRRGAQTAPGRAIGDSGVGHAARRHDEAILGTSRTGSRYPESGGGGAAVAAGGVRHRGTRTGPLLAAPWLHLPC
jgi:hypothetical protein